MWNKGQSLIELIIAVSILTIIAASSVAIVIHSFSTGRLAEDESQATALAVEGIEAVQSIRNQDWDDLSDGTYGIIKSNGYWQFSGSSDQQDGYTRQIIVEPVNRDQNGDIVQSGGTADDQTKKVTATIAWDFNPSRQNQVDMSQIMTNWQKVEAQGEVGQLETCTDYCLDEGYLGGTCRFNSQMCSFNSEIYETGGDQYCTEGIADSCCCQPDSGSEETCNSYCQDQGYQSGTCRANSIFCLFNGEIYNSGGDQYCSGGPFSDSCCCQE